MPEMPKRHLVNTGIIDGATYQTTSNNANIHGEEVSQTRLIFAQ